jgi:hypothetical protein
MRKLLFLLSLILSMMATAYSQTPQTYHSFVGGSNNSYPFNNSAGNKIQWLCLASGLTGGNPLVPGLITDIYIKAAETASSSTYTNFIVRMGTTSSTSMSTGSTPWITTGMQTVVNASSFAINNVVAEQWFKITLQTPFFYDGVSNIVLEISQTAFTGGFGVRQESIVSSYHRKYGTSGSVNCNNTDHEFINFGFDIAPASCSGAPVAGTADADALLLDCNTSTTVRLSGNTLGTGLHYQWQYNNGGGWTSFGLDADTQVTPNLAIPTQFRCVVNCTNPGGSSDTSAAVTVDINPLPVSLGDDTTICPGTTQVLDAGYSGGTYLWSNAATSQTITITTAGTYAVKVTAANGCIGHDTIAVNPGWQPVNSMPASVNLCAGTTITLNAGNAGCSYTWNTTETTQYIDVTMSGNYSVDIMSPDHCVAHGSTQVIERALPVVDLGNDTAICPGDAIVLNAGNPGNTFSWNTGATTQSVTAVDSGNYAVMVTNAYDCHAEDTMHLAYLSQAYAEGFNFIPLFYEELGKVSFSMLNPRDVISCQWDFGDGSPFSTDLTPSHVYASGNYLVTLTVFNGCGQYSVSLLIHVDTVTGIAEVINRNGAISLYPNPARNQVIIENKTGLPAQQLMVIDALGRMVYKKLNPNDKQVLDVSGFASGLYTVRLLTKAGWSTGKVEVVK